jgi:hypothetical protein
VAGPSSGVITPASPLLRQRAGRKTGFIVQKEATP